MAFSAGVIKNFLTGPGEHGKLVFLRAVLAAATPKDIYLDGLKLKDPDNAAVFVADDDGNTSGVPDTTLAIHSSGQYVTATDAGGGNVKLLVVGDLVRI